MKIFKSIVLFSILTLLFTSCSKENLEGPEIENLTKYYFNGQQVTLESLDQTKDLIYVHSKSNSIMVFDSNENYEAYLTDLSLEYEDGNEIRTQLEKAVQLNRISTKIALLADQKEKNKMVSEEMDQLLLELESLKNDNSKNASVMILYDNTNFGGSSKVTSGFVPSLRKKWRNRASSFRAFGSGLLTLCDGRFFSGNKIVYILITNFSDPNLGNRGFDNRLESYF